MGTGGDMEMLKTINDMLVKPLMEKVDELSTALREHRSDFKVHVVEEAERDKKFITRDEFAPVEKIAYWSKWIVVWVVVTAASTLWGIFGNVVASFLYDKYK